MNLISLRSRLLLLPGLLALLLAGDASSGCGGCYASGTSSDVQVTPASACLIVLPGRLDNGCNGSDSAGVVISNMCSGVLVLGAITVAPGERDVSVLGDPPASGAPRTLTGTLDGSAITISWRESVDTAAAVVDMGTGG